MKKFSAQLVLDWAKAMVVKVASEAGQVFDMDRAELRVFAEYLDRDDIIVADLVLPLKYGDSGMFMDGVKVIHDIMDVLTASEEPVKWIDALKWSIGDGDDLSACRLMADGLHIWVRNLND